MLNVFFIVGHVISFEVLFFVFPAVQIVLVLRIRAVAGCLGIFPGSVLFHDE